MEQTEKELYDALRKIEGLLLEQKVHGTLTRLQAKIHKIANTALNAWEDVKREQGEIEYDDRGNIVFVHTPWAVGAVDKQGVPIG